jgi:hypothetical protein
MRGGFKLSNAEKKGSGDLGRDGRGVKSRALSKV